MRVNLTQEELQKLPEHIREQIYEQYPELRPDPPFTGVEVLNDLQTRIRIIIDGCNFGEYHISEVIEKSYKLYGFRFRHWWKTWLKGNYKYAADIRAVQLPPELQFAIFKILGLELMWQTFCTQDRT